MEGSSPCIFRFTPPSTRAPPELSCPLMALEVESVTVLITGPTAATPFTTTFTSLRVLRKSLPMV